VLRTAAGSSGCTELLSCKLQRRQLRRLAWKFTVTGWTGQRPREPRRCTAQDTMRRVLTAAAWLAVCAGTTSNSAPGGAGEHTETAALPRAWHVPEAFSIAECAKIRALGTRHGVSESAGVLRYGPSYDDKYRKDRPPAEVRSTALQWLERDADTKWLYTRIMDVASLANVDAGWNYEGISHLQKLQIGMYAADADPPGHYMWHADEDWQAGERQHVRVLSVSVQLTDPQVRPLLFRASLEPASSSRCAITSRSHALRLRDMMQEYDGADLQVGFTNVSRSQGSVIVFSSYEMHKVHPITRGTRLSLVAWVMGAGSPDYWRRAISTQEELLREGTRLEAAGGDFPAPMKYETLAILGSAMLRQQNWQRAIDLSLAEISLAKRMHAHSVALRDVVRPFGNATFHGESLGKAYLRYSAAAGHLEDPQTTQTIRSARAGCDRASRITSGMMRTLSLECRSDWEYAAGDLPQSMLTKHEAMGLRLKVPRPVWVVASGAAMAFLLLCPLVVLAAGDSES
jgi:hypothetical protein